MGRTSSQPQVNLGLLCNNSLKFQHQVLLADIHAESHCSLPTIGGFSLGGGGGGEGVGGVNRLFSPPEKKTFIRKILLFLTLSRLERFAFLQELLRKREIPPK
jgi:hypothetical protein